MTLFLAAHLNVALCFQLSVDTKSILAVVDYPLPLFVRKAFYLPDFPIIGMNVVKLYLKRRMLLDEQDGFNISIFKSVVVANVEHGQRSQHYGHQ